MAPDTRTARAAKSRRHRRVRKKVDRHAERPRLAVFRSNRHIVAQVIDDAAGHTIAAASTVEASLRGGATGNIEAAERGRHARRRAAPRKRASRRSSSTGAASRYHGRVAALAEAARAAGLEF